MVRRRRAYYSSEGKNIRSKLITYGIIAGIAVGIGYTVYIAIESPSPIGAIGSAHHHIAAGIYINGEPLDLSEGKYQVQNRAAHFEDGDGNIVHKHATGVSMGFFLNTLGITFDDSCLFLDDGRQFCDNDGKTLKFYVNGAENELYDQYLLSDNDRILVSYGDENDEQINEQITNIQSVELPSDSRTQMP